MMKPVLVAVLLVGIALATPVQAQEAQQETQRYTALSGTKLAEICTARDRTQLEACYAYLSGVSDAITTYQIFRPENGSKGPPLEAYICLPGRATGPMLRDTYVAWARQHRDRLRYQASKEVIEALLAAYPCQR